ncbi:hypothetical protein B566_EDAN002598 [Ephemera danica]|nr:hypothetical protein B566_EDAN002598 [Ephemera danica]
MQAKFSWKYMGATKSKHEIKDLEEDKTTRSTSTDDSQQSQRSSKVQGDVLIFNQVKFQCGLEDRTGSEVDVRQLSYLLSALGLRIKIYQDFTRQEITNTLQNHADSTGLVNDEYDDCLVVIVMTHGGPQGLLYARDRSYLSSDLWKPYEHCESLRGRPKLFIFQTCRSDDVETNFIVSTENRKTLKTPMLPNYSDFLLAFNTIEDYMPHKHVSPGTWYITVLCNELESLKEPIDVLDLFTKVALRVSDLKDGKGQTPTFISLLNRKITIPVLEKQANIQSEYSLQTIELSSNRDISCPGKMDLNYEWGQMGQASILYTLEYESWAQTYQEALKPLRFAVEMIDLNSMSDLTERLTTRATNPIKNSFGQLVIVLANLTHQGIEKLSAPAIKLSGKTIPVQNICKPFTEPYCRHLKGKPKIFFFVDPRNVTLYDIEPVSQNNEDKATLISYQDIFQFFGYGSSCTETLLHELQEEHPKEVLDMCVHVMHEISAADEIRPHFQSTLRFPAVFSRCATRELYQKEQEKRKKMLHFEKLVEQSSEKLGAENPQTLTYMYHHAKKIYEDGNVINALTLHTDVLNTRTRVLGAEHSDTLTSMHAKSYILLQLGHHSDALSLLEKLVGIWSRALGRDHPNTLGAIDNQAYVLNELHRYDEALALYEEVLEFRLLTLGSLHVDTIQSMHNTAFTLSNLGRHSEALMVHEEVLEKRSQVLGPEHELTLNSMVNKAHALNALGRKREALALVNMSLGISVRVLGENHSQTKTLISLSKVKGY